MQRSLDSTAPTALLLVAGSQEEIIERSVSDQDVLAVPGHVTEVGALSKASGRRGWSFALTTISDVALAAGVSKSTVSRVLNDLPNIDPEMAGRVRRAVATLGYQPSRVAQALRTQQSKVWAVVITDVRNAFFTDVVRGIEDLAYSAGYSLVLCNADEQVSKEVAYIDLALAERVGGLILSPARPNAPHVGKVLASGTPIVTINGRLDDYDVDRVLTNNTLGGREATLHLIGGGYERIACITGPKAATTAQDRLQGYVSALAASGHDMNPDLVRHGDYQEESGFTEMNKLLGMRKPPDAVFVANNQMTLGALEAIDQAGFVIPDEIGLVGFDDVPWAPFLRPALTTVAQPTRDIGLETGRLLLSRVDGYTGRAREVILSPELKVRASSSRSTGTTSASSRATPASGAASPKALARPSR